ncbi:hypothetical protein BDV19DRAFT_352710 [Aspergillus venezuelensis]
MVAKYGIHPEDIYSFHKIGFTMLVYRHNAGRLAIIQKQLGDSALIALSATGTDNKTVSEPVSRGTLSLSSVEMGTSGAFRPFWSSISKLQVGCLSSRVLFLV